jgi:hypothetical protein
LRGSPATFTVWDALPDGRLVLAQTDDHGVLMAKVVGDTTERELSWLDAPAVEDLSADGKWLLFSEFGQGGGHDNAAYLRATDGSAAIRLASGRALALSPDAKWVICGRRYSALALSGDHSDRCRQRPAAEGHGLSTAVHGFWPTANASLFWRTNPIGWHDSLSTTSPLRLPYRSRQKAPGRLWCRRMTRLLRSSSEPPSGSTTSTIHVPRLARSLVSQALSFPSAGRRAGCSWCGTVTLPATAGAVTQIDPKTGRQSLWRDLWPRDRAGLLVMGSFEPLRMGLGTPTAGRGH